MATSNQRGPILDRVAAGQQNWGIRAPAANPEVEGLIRGLATLNPALERYGASQQNLEQAQTEAQRAEVSALAQQQADALDMQGKSAIEFAGNPTPAQVPPALGKHYREVFSKALGEREGIKAKDQGIAAYNEAKDKPDFNVDTFLGEYRAKALGGLEGVPILAAQVGNQVNTFEVQVRADAQRQAMLRHTETRNATVAQTFTDELRPDLPADALFQTYTQKLLPQAEGLGMSKKEGAQLLLQRLSTMSEKMGGNPAVFDIFERKDAEGLSLASRNPELSTAIQAARKHAQALSESRLKADSQERNFLTMAELEKQLKADPASITLDVIRANMGPAAPFATHDEAFAYWNKAQKAAEEQLGTAQLQSAYDNKQMYLLSPADQKKVMEANLGPYAAKMADAASKGDVASVTTLAENIMRAQSAVGAKEPLQALEQFINTTVTSMPGKAPSPAFEAAAAMYRAYSADPAFRDVYFKGDAAEVMRSYVSGAVGGDKQAAYESAYLSISPESRARAAKLVDTPEFKKKLTDITKAIQGSSWWPQWLGGSGRPDNAGGVELAALPAVRDYVTKNPGATAEDAKDFASDWVNKNFVHDVAGNVAIQVPPGLAGKLTQEALSAYTKRVGDEFRAGRSEHDRADWKVSYEPRGDLGDFAVVMRKGAAEARLGHKTLQEMRADFRADSSLTSPEERAGIAAIRKQLASGAVEPAFLASQAPLLAKIRRLGLDGFGPAEFKRLDAARDAEMLARVRSIPMVALGPVDSSNLQFIPQRGAKVDNKLTAQTAAGFMTQAVSSVGGLSTSLAGSLITMAEGTVLQAYPDPAKDAGNNIGMGYNLKANAGNASGDLKRAGVPEDRIQDVIDGKAQLTQDQARRLLLVAMPRYEGKARDAAEAAQPGLWARMSPNQQAVMTDIAYSVGSADQFKKAWAAIAAGDAEAFKANVMTTYVNKAGERVQDTRRFNLRAAMLAGTPRWNAEVSKFGGFPSNQMDAIALNSQK
jgi:GH24 family phage-related lysozyme (muramidase)